MYKQQISLYIHFPFCKQKCKYCAFFSKSGKERTIPTYLQAIRNEIAFYKDRLIDYEVSSIYLGGGTPSLLSANDVGKTINDLKTTFQFESDIEISIEVNPESIDKDKLKTYKKAGINRISIGLQAWQNKHLSYLGRLYTREQFETVLYAVKAVGFTNINLDLIFCYPKLTLKEWQETLDTVIRLNVHHIACYSLELEPNSVFGTLHKVGKFTPVKETTDRKMYRLAQELLTENGFVQYEISNFAKPGFECRHNLSFWHYQPYVGIGAGAHSFFMGKRYQNCENIESYCRRMVNQKKLTIKAKRANKRGDLSEEIIHGLRLTEGLSIEKLNNKYSVDLLSKYSSVIKNLKSQKLITCSNSFLKLTKKGLDFADYVATNFI